MTSIFETLSVRVTNPLRIGMGAVHVPRLQAALRAPKDVRCHGSLNQTPKGIPLVSQLMQLSLYLRWLSLAKVTLQRQREFAALGPCCAGTSPGKMPLCDRGLGIILMVAVRHRVGNKSKV